MKKSLLALAVLGAFTTAAQAQSTVTIYGIIDTGVTYTNKAASSLNPDRSFNTGNKFAVNSGILQGSRIGFKGTEDLGGGLSAVFNLETGFKNDTGMTDGKTNELFRRKSVVGLQGSFGTVLLGRQTDFLDDIGGSMTSVGDFGGVVANSGSGLSRLQGSRTNNSIRYNTNNLGGFTGSVIYGFGEQAGQTSAGQAFGIGGKYENGPLALAAAYYQSKQGATPADTQGTLAPPANEGDTQLKTFTLAAAYLIDNAKIYANWSRIKQSGAVDSFAPVLQGLTPTNWIIGGSNNDKVDAYELGGNYALSPSLKLLASVQHSRIGYTNADTPKGKLTQINLGADYWLSKRTDLYAFLSNIRTSNTFNPGILAGNSTLGADSQTALNIGIRHKF